MRASRVQSSTTALYRQHRPVGVAGTDGAFQNMYSQGDEQHSLLNQNKKDKKQRKKQMKLSTIKTKMIMKGMQLSGETMHIHNHLIRRSSIANSANLMRTRNHTYRTSI